MDSSAAIWRSQTDVVRPDIVKGDIAIVGAGFAGALAALVLARHGLSPIVIDPYDPYPDDFRCEKFSRDQVVQFDALGVTDAFGLPRAALTTQGLRYDTMVNALRRQWPDSVRFLKGKVAAIKNSPDRQGLALNDGLQVDSRLVVVATGAGAKLRNDLGLVKRIMSEAHSVCIGFSLRGAFGFDNLVHHGERAGDRVGYASLFRMGSGDHPLMRVNLFLYDDPRSARVRAFRLNPLGELVKAMPALRNKLLLAEVDGPVETRVNDLHEIEARHVPGVVLIGDARRTSCPASCTGISRITSDVIRLSRDYIFGWLKDEGMPATHMASFYDDRTRSEDEQLHRRSLSGRTLAVDTGPTTRLRRLARRLRNGLSRSGQVAVPATQVFTGDQASASPQCSLSTTFP